MAYGFRLLSLSTSQGFTAIILVPSLLLSPLKGSAFKLKKVETIDLLKIDIPPKELVHSQIERIYSSGQLSNFGPLNHELELGLSKLVSPNKAISTVTTSSGTTALELALSTIVRKNQSRRVLVPSLTFPATAHAVLNAGLEPVWGDVDLDTWQLKIESAYTAAKGGKIAAVVPVAAFGRPVDTASWNQFSKETGIPVVIDAAGAFGDQKVEGQLSVIFSFHATKAFAIGEGGCVMSEDLAWLDRIRTASNFGFEQGEVQSRGSNCKLSEIHAAVGLAVLETWSQTKMQRQKLAQKYADTIDEMQDKYILQTDHWPWIRSVFVVRSKSRKALAIAQHCSTHGIQTRRWYAPPLHKHRYFEQYTKLDDLSSTELLSEQLIGLPFHAKLDDQQLEKVRAALMSLPE
jgi:dTDP-4-amino-4,6-dideoxygalactose transaminase